MNPNNVRADGTKFSFKSFLGLINQAKPKYVYLIIGILFASISSAITVYVPKLAQSLINQFSQGIDYALLIKVVILFVLSAIISALGGTILGIFGEQVIANLRKNLWSKLTTLSVTYYDTAKSGEVASRLVNDTSQVKQLLANVFPQTFAAVITLVGSVYMMFRMEWHMTLAMVIVVPLAMLLMIPVFKFGSVIGHQRQDALSEFSGIATETLSEIRLVKTSNAEQQVQKRANTEVQKLFKVGKKEALFDAIMQPFMMMVMMSMIFGLLAYGMHRIATGAMQIGTLMSFLMYLFNMIGALPMLAQLFTEMAKAAGSTKRVSELLEQIPEDFTSGEAVDLSGKTLVASHVDFAYDTDNQILRDVSFEAKSGQVIAFAGPSGGGKSTVFSLLERFYTPTNGQIKIDGQEISDFNLTDYRKQIGFVSQDSAIMAGTIRDNLTYGLDMVFTDDELWHVLSLAYAKDFVAEMPDQLMTDVGERGVKISGGQRQRLAIARAFLRDPKILMLDEATASLDSESEMMVQAALANLMRGRTTLVIAHRLATIVDSDKIYFIEKGEVTGAGSHDELVNSHSKYAEYVKEQILN